MIVKADDYKEKDAPFLIDGVLYEINRDASVLAKLAADNEARLAKYEADLTSYEADIKLAEELESKGEKVLADLLRQSVIQKPTKPTIVDIKQYVDITPISV